MTMDFDARRIADGWSGRAFRALLKRVYSLARRRHARKRRARETDARHIDGSLIDWARAVLPEHFRLAPSAMHAWLAERLDAMRGERGTKLNLIGPRGSAKSTVATLAYVLRCAVEGTEPYVWIVSDTRHQACAHLENIKSELVESSLLAERYPGSVGIGPVWRAGTIVLANRVMIEAFGTGQKLRGRRRRAHRPSLIVCDDLQNDAHVHSRLRREHCREWFYAALLQAGTPRTNVVHLATALHRECLALELDRTPGWTSRTFRAIERWPENEALWEAWRGIYCDLQRADSQQADSQQDDARTAARAFFDAHREAMEAGSRVLWPELEDLYALRCLETEVGRTAFAREKQSSPVNPQRCEFPEEYFADGLSADGSRAESLWFDAWPTAVRFKTVALDPSKGASDRVGDYSAFVRLAVDTAGVLYVQADMARRPTQRIVEDGVAMIAEFRPDAFGVEANQFQELLAAEFQRALAARELGDTSLWLVSNNTDKQVRIRTLGPFLSQRRMRFKSGCASTRMLVDQLRDFPIADHDDGPDALEMAIRLASALAQGARQSDGLGDRIRLSV
jgi:predicted phage terminase large subunit-like protein